MTDTGELLHQCWGMSGAEVQPLGGGMSSETRLEGHVTTPETTVAADTSNATAG